MYVGPHDVYPTMDVNFSILTGECKNHHHHHQSLFIHEIVSFYMVFLGIVFKTRLKYSKELFDYNVKMQKLTLLIRVTMSHGE